MRNLYEIVLSSLILTCITVCIFCGVEILVDDHHNPQQISCIDLTGALYLTDDEEGWSPSTNTRPIITYEDIYPDDDPLFIYSTYTNDTLLVDWSMYSTNIYTCEPYQNFNSRSDQYRLQLDSNTDENGLRYFTYNNELYYTVAMGNAFGHTIGDAWLIELVNGYSFNVVMGDFKHPIKDDPYDYGDLTVNYDGEETINVIEFIADLDILPKSVIKAGTMSALDRFGGLYGNGGNIERITYLGKVWNNG